MISNSTKRRKVCGNKCVVCGKSKFSHEGLKLFIFPRKDEARCEKWIDSTGYFELKYLPLEAKRYVCELHFDDKDFMSILRKRLMPNAVPKKSEVQQIIPVNKPTSYYRSPIKRNDSLNKSIQDIPSNMSTSTNEMQENILQSDYNLYSKDLELNQNWSLGTLTSINDNSHYNNLNQVHYQKDTSQQTTREITETVEPIRKRKTEFIPMIQPYYKRNCRPGPCKHCKRKDKTIIALRKKVRELKRVPFKHRIDQLKNISNDSKIFAKMFLTHGSHRVWTEEEKTFAIDLLNKSASAYYFLRHNKKLILPSKASVQSWIKERTNESNDQQQIQLKLDEAVNINPVVTEIQQLHHIPNASIITSMDNLTPLACSLEIPMTHPNDNIVSIPEVVNDIPSHMQTMTTLEPIHSAMHHLTTHNNIHEQSHLSAIEPHYKYAYQIITQEGISNKSTYIIQLNES